ncbi:MAG TPA: WD40 repeat domain-containing protein [Methylomirabilota bacterium]|nr:WD40 repeat domain-containing protein [Methylomirabilota bacterium]
MIAPGAPVRPGDAGRAMAQSQRRRSVALVVAAGLLAGASAHGDSLWAASVPPAGNADFVLAAFSEDGASLVTASVPTQPARVRLFDARTGKLINSIDGVRGVEVGGGAVGSRQTLLVSNDGRRVVVRGRLHAPLEVRATDTGAVLGTVPSLAERSELYGFGATGEALVLGLFGRWDRKSGGVEVQVAVWDYLRGRLTADVPLPERKWVAAPVLAPNGSRLALSGASRSPSLGPTAFYVFDVGRRSLQTFPNAGGWVWGFAFSSDGATLAVGGDSDIELRDLTTGLARRTGRCPNDRNQFLKPRRFSPDGARLVAEGDRGQVCVFDVATGMLIGSGNAPTRTGYDEVLVSTDASRAVVYRVDDTFEIWDTRTARRLTALVPVPRSKRGRLSRRYLLSPDGGRLFRSDRWENGAWDTETGAHLFTLDDPTWPHPHNPNY